MVRDKSLKNERNFLGLFGCEYWRCWDWIGYQISLGIKIGHNTKSVWLICIGLDIVIWERCQTWGRRGVAFVVVRKNGVLHWWWWSNVEGRCGDKGMSGVTVRFKVVRRRWRRVWAKEHHDGCWMLSSMKGMSRYQRRRVANNVWF
jgi:hypothetical protein